LGLLFNGIHSDFFNIAVRTTKIPYIPEKRQNTVTVQGRDGGYTFEDGYNNIKIPVSCSFTTATLIERRKTARAIATWLNTSVKPAILIFDYEPDIEYRVVKIINNIEGAFRGALVPVDDFDIIFECEPYQQQTFFNDNITWDDMTFAWKYADIMWAGDYPRTFTGGVNADINAAVTNLGTHDADYIMKVSATGLVGALTIDLDNYLPYEWMQLTHITDTVYIDSKEKEVYTIVAGVKVNKFQDFASYGDFLKIRPGVNNFSIYGTLTTVTVEFIYKNTYL